MFTFLNKTLILKTKPVTWHQIQEKLKMCFKIAGILYWDVKHAQTFEADHNMRLRPCHISDITQCIRVHLPLQGHFQKTLSTAVIRSTIVYTIHINSMGYLYCNKTVSISKYTKRRSPLLIPSSAQGFWLTSLSFTFFFKII